MMRFFVRLCLVFSLLLALLSIQTLAAERPALTFFAISDLHYNWPAPGDYKTVRATIDQMNATPGQAYPAALGGAVGTPRGTIVLGDLVESPLNHAWATWAADYGMTGERRLRFPVFEGLGNHDSGGKENWAGLKARNARRAGLDGVSDNGYHYSWTWNGIHFVMLNVYPADAADPNVKSKVNPRGALAFLKQDLREHVGRGGRPVVLLHHYNPIAGNWWSQRQIDAYYEAIKACNVIAILHGHTHLAETYRWRGIDVLSTGSVKKLHPETVAPCFFVARIEGNHLSVLQRTVDGRWGKVRLQKTFADGRHEAPVRHAPARRPAAEPAAQ